MNAVRALLGLLVLGLFDLFILGLLDLFSLLCLLWEGHLILKL